MEQLLELTHLERIGPKGWLRYIFPFQLAENYDIDEVTRVLRSGYEATCRRLPVMGCEAVADTDANQAGVLKLKPLQRGDIELVAVKDLRADGAFPMTFSELKAQNFPVSCLEASKLYSHDVWPRPGGRFPVSLVQFNFIPGGVIISWAILHMFGDSVTFGVWTEVWAEECRRAQGLIISDPVQIEDRMLTDRSQVMKPSGRNTGNPDNHPEYLIIPDDFPLTGPPPGLTSTTHRGQVFYLSPEALVALKNDASPSHATHTDENTPKWISTNDAVSALLWRTVMAVQHPIETLTSDPTSSFVIAIDGRLRTNPLVHPRTLGCFLEYVGVEMSIRNMLLTASLADIAVEIRKAVLKADQNWTDEIVTLVEGLKDVDRLIPKAFTDVPGYHCIQSSWTKFPVYDLNWGELLGNKIQAMRCPDVGVIHGLQIPFPPLPNGGLEVLVGVEERHLDGLLHDPVWTKYAVPRSPCEGRSK